MLLHFTEQEVPTAERNLVSELQDSRLAALLIFRHKEHDTADGGGGEQLHREHIAHRRHRGAEYDTHGIQCVEGGSPDGDEVGGVILGSASVSHRSLRRFA